MNAKPAFTRRSFPATPAAIVAVGLAAACAAPLLATQTVTEPAAKAPLICGVVAQERGGMVTFRPWLRAETEISGDYRLSLARVGTLVEQGGAFEADAGARIELGTATLPGTASGYQLRLGVTAGGIQYTCRGDAAEV